MNTTHGPGAIQQMKAVALATGGRSYNVTKATELPGIYMKETRLISKSYVYNQKFTPELRERAGPTEGLPSNIVPMSAPEIAKAITVTLAFPVRVTLMVSAFRAELPTEYHSSRYIELPDPEARCWNDRCGDVIP